MHAHAAALAVASARLASRPIHAAAAEPTPHPRGGVVEEEEQEERQATERRKKWEYDTQGSQVITDLSTN